MRRARRNRLDHVISGGDVNRDGMISREEFVDAMGKAYDRGLVKMKSDAKMAKGNLMTMDGAKSLFEDLYRGSN
jgi:hypothetical protein